MESIGLHFRTVDWKTLHTFRCSVVCRIGDDDLWAYPDCVHTLVRLYEGDTNLNEYEDHQIDKLAAVLGDLPNCSLIIELRRAQQNLACEAAECLTLLLLEQFAGVTDDYYSEIWTREEIAAGVRKQDGKFLDCYRVPEN